MAKRSRGAGRKKGAAKKSKPRLTHTPTPSGTIPVVCSECYTDFLYVTLSESKNVSCPACGHGGSVPEAGEVQRLEMAKASEKKAFLSAVVPGILFLLFGFFYFMQLNSAGSADALGPTMNYGLIAVTVLLFLITIVFAARYEKARCEVYF